MKKSFVKVVGTGNDGSGEFVEVAVKDVAANVADDFVDGVDLWNPMLWLEVDDDDDLWKGIDIIATCWLRIWVKKRNGEYVGVKIEGGEGRDRCCLSIGSGEQSDRRFERARCWMELPPTREKIPRGFLRDDVAWSCCCC